ncbi:MAG: LysR family transcriptional regulator substrate-binding protein, partial [Thermoactinomyces sp.]
TRKHIIEQMESLGHKPNIISEVAFGDFILGAVTAGMGITIIPELMAKNIIHLQLFALPITNFGRKRSISLATRCRKLGTQLYKSISTSVESPSTMQKSVFCVTFRL